ncbi:allantoinase [Rhizocola hellebori]|uniref:allantoinase n=1 Tax=Rhizocola hellebori TaxID=1392758 RepID=A0A8J3VGX5_9ACTN|nr:allantoinase AllB [Rhizocola hellebori]GIH05441.1 allantoinase [Rhizocola hellebori]
MGRAELTAIRSRRVVLPNGERPATLRIDDGKISEILPYESGAGAYDCGDDALLPGLVDTHVHINEPGRTQWEGFATATRAAAAGGVTTLLDMPLNSLPPTVEVAALKLKREAAQGQCVVDVGFWGGAIPQNLADLRPLHEAGVYGFKCFLADSGVPEFPPLDSAQLQAVLGEVRRFGGLLIVHAESAAALGQLGESQRYQDFLDSRPGRAEVEAIALLAELAQGARVHVLHLSCAEALETIAAAKRRGVKLTAETCPHYLTLTAEEIANGATEFKCCPPIRDAGNRDRLWAGLAAGTIDCVVSDHSPATPELKLTGSFTTAWGGIASLQLGLPLMWTQARQRGHGLTDIVRWMADAPARLAGVTGKGRISVGAQADLVQFQPEADFVVDPAALHHRHPVSPYAGRRLTGVVRSTWLAGAAVDPDKPSGRLLTR